MRLKQFLIAGFVLLLLDHRDETDRCRAVHGPEEYPTLCERCVGALGEMDANSKS
jgi:hypothetical protein